MAWSFTNLDYGWRIAAGITLAAATIYVANNTRQRVNQADVVELALGVTERYMAVGVAFPSVNTTWTSNYYYQDVWFGETQWLAEVATENMTNVIGWRVDRAMLGQLDSLLTNIISHYVDPNTISGNPTGMAMLTVTGLWASLGIGDGTNQFTSVPSNGTDVATYGPLPTRIMTTHLIERYKVINALSVASGMVAWADTQETYTNLLWSNTTVFATNVAHEGTPLNWETEPHVSMTEEIFSYYWETTNIITAPVTDPYQLTIAWPSLSLSMSNVAIHAPDYNDSRSFSNINKTIQWDPHTGWKDLSGVWESEGSSTPLASLGNAYFTDEAIWCNFTFRYRASELRVTTNGFEALEAECAYYTDWGNTANKTSKWSHTTGPSQRVWPNTVARPSLVVSIDGNGTICQTLTQYGSVPGPAFPEAKWTYYAAAQSTNMACTISSGPAWWKPKFKYCTTKFW